MASSEHRVIFEAGEVVEFDGARWFGKDRDLVELCRDVAESFDEDRPGYHPNRSRAIVEYVAETLGVDFIPSERGPESVPGLIY